MTREKTAAAELMTEALVRTIESEDGGAAARAARHWVAGRQRSALDTLAEFFDIADPEFAAKLRAAEAEDRAEPDAAVVAKLREIRAVGGLAAMGADGLLGMFEAEGGRGD